MFKGYLKSNIAFLLCLFAITVFDIILIFTGNVIAISNLFLILLYISVDYRFYVYRTIHENDIELIKAIDEFDKSMKELNKDMENLFKENKNKENKD